MVEQFLVPMLTLILGALLGHWVTTRSIRARIAAERRVDDVSEFIGQAYTNLPCLSDAERAQKALERIGDFAVVCYRASFLLGTTSAAKIDHFRATWADALRNVSAAVPTQEDQWTRVKRELDQLRDLLRSTVLIEKRAL
jgi:hypothetical protein